MDKKQLISEARAQLATLEGQLDDRRTPFMKSRLRFAGHLLDDAEAAVRHATENLEAAALWYSFANFSIAHAKQIAETVQQAGERGGGLANLIEIGG